MISSKIGSDLHNSILEPCNLVHVKLLAELQELYLGLIVFGSTCRHGVSSETLDIDLIAVTACDWRQKRVFGNSTLRFDLTLLPEREVIRAFSSVLQPGVLDAFSTGIVFYDRSNVMTKLHDSARKQYYSSLAPKLNAEQVLGMRLQLTQMASKLERTAHDTTSDLIYFRSYALLTTLEYYIRLRRMWKPAPKRLISTISAVDPVFASLLCTAYGREGAPPSASVVVDCIMFVLALTGGPLDQWISSKQKV